MNRGVKQRAYVLSVQAYLNPLPSPPPLSSPSSPNEKTGLPQLTSQFRMGTFLEERWGTRNWLIIYWVGGLGGNLLSCVASPDKASYSTPRCVTV